MAGEGESSGYSESARGIKNAVLLLPVLKVGDGWPKLRKLEIGFPNHDQTTGVLVWHRMKQNLIYNAENGGVGPDAQRQRDDRYCRKTGVLTQLAQAKAEVLE